jgi:hypothetical protein
LFGGAAEKPYTAHRKLSLIYLGFDVAKHLLSIQAHIHFGPVGWRHCKTIKSILQNILHLDIFRLSYLFDETKYLIMERSHLPPPLGSRNASSH